VPGWLLGGQNAPQVPGQGNRSSIPFLISSAGTPTWSLTTSLTPHLPILATD